MRLKLARLIGRGGLLLALPFMWLASKIDPNWDS